MNQWAQLKGGPPPPGGLERGHWYRVESIVNGTVLRVLGRLAIGVMVDMRAVRIVDQEPEKVTRIPATSFRAVRPGDAVPMLTFRGVCPRGHDLPELSLTATAANCSECNRPYDVEDEEHF